MLATIVAIIIATIVSYLMLRSALNADGMKSAVAQKPAGAGK